MGSTTASNPTSVGRPSLGPFRQGRRRSFVGADITLLVVLFLGLRLGAAVFLQSGGNVFQGEHDLEFFRSIGELSLDGHYPYLDYWMEYPPLFPWAIVAVYQLSLLLPSWPINLLWFQVILSAFLALFDVGNLVLVYGLARALHGPRVALRAAWIYALLFFPLFVTLSWFDTVPLFFLLLGTWLGVRGRAGSAGAALGLGLMVKIVPIVAAPVAFLGLPRLADRVRFVATLAIAVGGVAAPFLLTNPTMFVASVRFIATRQSWETIWALLEGYGGLGRVPLLASRFDPALVNFQLHPSSLPWPAIDGVFVAICLALFTRRLDWSRPAVAIPAVALTLNLFLLFSKGYSPQFLVYPLALLVVVLPNGWGVAYALLLTAVGSIEWPWAFGLFADDQRMLWLVVVTRTLLLLWVSAEYVGLLFGQTKGAWARWRAPVGRTVLGAGVLAVVAGGALVAEHYLRPTRPGDADAVAAYVRSFPGPSEAAIASSRDAFYQIRPLVAVDRWTLAEGDDGQWPAPIETRIANARQGRDRVWLILDQSGPQGDVNNMTQTLDAWGSPASDLWFGRFHLLGYLPFASAQAAPSVPLRASFGGAFVVSGYDLSTRALAPGDGLTLALAVSPEGGMTKDTKAFVHLEDAKGQVIAQRDRLLTHGPPMSGTGAARRLFRESFDVVVPPATRPGDYTLLAGLYDPTTGKRLKVTSGQNAGDDKIVLGTVMVRRG